MEHPIQGLMDTAMSNIKAMVDVDTVIGDPFTAADGTVVIPISTVSFGFGAGGSDFSPKAGAAVTDKLFGGGCGGGATVKPDGFLVLSNGSIRYLPLNGPASPVDKLIDMVPELLTKLNNFASKKTKKQPKENGGQQEDAQECEIKD